MHQHQGPRKPALLLRIFAVSIVVILISSSAQAQSFAGKIQPDRLPMGTVRVGATVEGSFRIFASGKDTSGIQVKVDPPPFVRIRQTHLGTQTYGSEGTYIVCDVSISVNTEREGNYSDPIKVQVGKQQVEIPVNFTVVAKEPDDTRLLVVETPFHKFSTDDSKVFNPWLELVTSAKLGCHYLEVERNQPVLRDLDLSDFDVVLLGARGLAFVQDADTAKLKEFLEGGGRVVVTANAFFKGTVEMANELLVPYGLRMSNTEPRSADILEIGSAEISDHPLTKDVRTLKFHRPSPIAIADEKNGRILVAAPPYPGQAFVAVAGAGDGEIVALGTSLWWNWIAGEEAKGADNSLLLRNLLTKPRNQK